MVDEESDDSQNVGRVLANSEIMAHFKESQVSGIADLKKLVRDSS